jgi:hypothetical protein
MLDGDNQVPEVAGGPSIIPVMKGNSGYANSGSGVGSLYGTVATTSVAGFNPMGMLLPATR